MPTYSYVCKDCGHAFDIQQAFTDNALTTCPTCGGTLRKVFSAVGVVFKGSGFYRNDSRESSKGKGSSTSPGGSSTGKGEGSSEGTKPKGSESTTPATKDSKGTGSSSTSSSSTSTPAASSSSTGSS